MLSNKYDGKSIDKDLVISAHLIIFVIMENINAILLQTEFSMNLYEINRMNNLLKCTFL